MILDTSLLIEAEREKFRIDRLLESLGEEGVSIAAITASELLHGCHRAQKAGARARRFAFVEGILDAVPIASFGLTEARRHAELWAELARQGKMIGAHDLLIAATALARGEKLATLNRAEFKWVPGLQLLRLDAFLS